MGGPLEGFDPAAGLEVPKGDPDGLNGAARQFSGAAEGLTTHENTIQRATHAPSWQGGAADAYVSLNTITVGYANQASDAMSRGASAAKSLATALRAAQEQARAAIAKLEGMRTTAAGISGAYDSAMALPAEDRGSQLKMLGMAVADFHAGVGSLRAEVADAHQKAEEAAERAAQAFGEVADMAPSVVASRTRRILERVAAGDYSSLGGVDMDYLSVAAQRAIASYAAGDVQSNLAAGEGLDELRTLSAMVGRYQHDDEFAAAFFNRMGGSDAGMMHWNAGFWYFQGQGHDDQDLMNLMAPFAMLMGTATRSGDLEEEFTDDFLGRQYEMRDRLLYHNAMEHFIRAGSASNYDGTFLAEVGQELLIDAGAGSVAHDPSEELLSFISGNPEASGRLLNGNSAQGLSNLYSLMSNYHWTDDGAALGAVVEAGAHDLRYYDLDLANEVAHKVILISPEFSMLPDGVKPALVTIADDHIVAFEHAALERVASGRFELPGSEIRLDYRDGEDYLAMLFEDDATEKGITGVIGERVSENIMLAAAHDA
ncbi:MAG: putative T7SS-secreted protein, partial [Actinomycetota bacterium]